MTDARFQLDVKIDYEENCEYKASTINKTVSIPSQDTTCSITTSANSVNIGNSCTITATVKTSYANKVVKSGYVNFFFTPNQDKTNAVQINKTPYSISKDGKVSIKYKPVRNGYFFAKYDDYSNFFNESESAVKSITANKITTTIRFIDNNTNTDKYVEDLNEEITIKVQVKDNIGNPVRYGAVTFLHYPKPINDYNLTDDKHISIIGNPVYLDENGYATLTYTPMQHYDEDSFLLDNEQDVEIYKEVIKAAYNYDNSWDYYVYSQSYCDIYLKRPNIIRIEVLNSQEYDYKWNYITESNNIRLKATLSDNISTPNANNVQFNNGDKILFHIKGTRAIPNGDVDLAENNVDYFIENNFTYTEIEYNNIVGTYNNDGFYAQLSDNNIYLYPGFYTITAELDVDKGTHSGYTEYLADTTPIEFYLQVIYSSNTSIHMSAPQALYNYNRGQTINDIVFTVTNLTQDELYVLAGKKCYFYSVTDNHYLYSTDLVQVGSTLQATFSGSRIDNTVIQDYKFYAYIIGKYYSNGDVSRKINRIESSTVTVSIRDTLDISINATLNNNAYPADVEYNASIENIYQGSIKASIYNKNKTTNVEQKLQDVIFGPNVSEYHSSITNPLIPANYSLIIRTPNNADVVKNYTIVKSVISQTLADESAEVINNPNERVNLILTTSGNDFTDINNNNFQLEIKKHNSNTWTQIQNPDILFNKVQNNTVMYLRCKTAQYEMDEWDIRAKYNDTNFTTDNTYGTFVTCGINPTYEIAEYLEGDKINIQISGTSYPQCVPILIKVFNSNNMEKFIGVTNQNGAVSIPYPNVEDWDELTNIELIVNPTHADLIQSISSNTTNHLSSAINGYSRVYFGLTNDNDATIYNYLRNQLSTYENKYLFIIYNENSQIKSRTFR